MFEASLHYNTGTYFILPLKYRLNALDSLGSSKWIKTMESNGWQQYNWVYSDYYAHINELFSNVGNSKSNVNSKGVVGIEFEKPLCQFESTTINTAANNLYSIKDSGGLELYFRSFHIIALHSGVGFLVIGVESKYPQIIRRIRNEGYNYNDICYFESQNNQHVNSNFSIVELIQYLLSNTGFIDFAEELLKEQGNKSLFRDATVYSIGRITDKDKNSLASVATSDLRKLCLDLRYARSIGTEEKYEDTDTRSFSTVASPNCEGNVRWMTYSIFQHTVQIIKSADLNEIINHPDENYLPFLIMALYIRYSCMFFSELLGTNMTKKKKIRLWIEEQMIRMKALGVIEPSEMTPYSNFNQFYEGQQEIYGLKDAMASISDKLALVQNIRSSLFERMESIITVFVSVFGVFSILSNIMSIAEIYNRYGTQSRLYTIIGTIALALFVIFAFIRAYVKSRWKGRW